MSVRYAHVFALIAASSLIGLLAVQVPLTTGGMVSRIAWGCAVTSLVLSTALLVIRLVPPAGRADRESSSEWSKTIRGFALLFGAAAASLQGIVLVMRAVYVVVDILHGYPWRGMREYGFGFAGLWTLSALAGSAALGLAATRDARLATCLFWALVMGVSWACLLADPYRVTSTGGFEHTDATLVWAATLAALLLVFVLAAHATTRSGHGGPPRAGGTREAGREGDPPPGLRASVTALALLLTLASCYHLLVPMGPSGGGIRASATGVCVTCGMAAAGCFILLHRSWGYLLADAGMGLCLLGCCAVPMHLVPAASQPLAETYPSLFTAIMVGAAAATAINTQLACRWRTAEATDAPSFRQRLAPHASHFAFLSGAMAVMAGSVMVYWPELPGVAVMDHSLGRVTSGFAANLFVLLILLSSCRRLSRSTFHLLTVLSALSAAAFLYVRIAPFSSAG